MSTVDYILFTTADVTLNPEPNEVSDTCWVSKAELEAMFADQGELFVAPVAYRRLLTRPVNRQQLHAMVQAHRRVLPVQMVGCAD